jgi:hypothetical protein
LPVFTVQDGRSSLAFVGAPDRLEFVTRSRREQEGGGLVYVQIALETNDDGARRLVTIRNSWSPGTAPKTRTLLESVGGVSLRYFGRTAPIEPPEWTNSWSNRSALPNLVEVSITSARDSDTLDEDQKTIVIPILGQ